MILMSKGTFIGLAIVICVVYALVNGYVTMNIIKSYGIGLGKAFSGKTK